MYYSDFLQIHFRWLLAKDISEKNWPGKAKLERGQKWSLLAADVLQLIGTGLWSLIEDFEIQLGGFSSIWVCLTIKNMLNNMILESPKSLGFSLVWKPYMTFFHELHHNIVITLGILEIRFPEKCARQWKFFPEDIYLSGNAFQWERCPIAGTPLMFIPFDRVRNIKAKEKFVYGSWTLL